MRRLMLYDRLGNPLGELAEADVFEAVLREEINGEHSLTITTTRVLDKGIRLLYQDGRLKWREFVVAGVDAEHASGNRAIGTYYCVWSVQQDLQGVTVSVMPGVQSPTTAALALTSLLSTTGRWTRGTVTQMTTGGASMYDRSAWEALSTLVEVWGGEIDAAITIGTQSGVVGRAVDLYAAQGEQNAMRRFDFGADLMSVKRTLADSPLFCRISPRGKGEETDAGGYGRKITIESVNSGMDWLEYAPMVDAAKLPDGSGGYEYPTLIVENSDCETPADLKTWAQSVIAQYCTPKVTYEVDVVQAGIEGVDMTGVSLGDAVQVVDRKFGRDGIRVQGRVRSITTDLLNERDITVVIGDAEESISSKFAKVDKSLASVNNDLTVMSTAEYIDNLLERINTEINATGGYTYIVPGNGILTFDVAVADPLDPVEASQVVEVKGGSIRIANSKTAQGAWEWKTVFTSGHIAADLVTAANLVTGMIQPATGGSYWDLDNNEFVNRTSTSNIWGKYEQLKMGSITFREGSGFLNGVKTSQTLYGMELGPSVGSGYGTGKLTLVANVPNRRYTTNVNYPSISTILASDELVIGSNLEQSVNTNYFMRFGEAGIELNATDGTTVKPGIIMFSDGTIHLGALLNSYTAWPTSSIGSSAIQILSGSNPVNVLRGLTVSGNLSVSGTKSRRVDTGGYGDRLLYAYETPTPIFGDVGSGLLDDEGLCYVELDGMFAEATRTDLAYQVFVQPHGQGEAVVSERHMTHFVVQGTPGLEFDWEVKCRQSGYENTRMERDGVDESISDAYDLGNPLDLYDDYMTEIEALHASE